jgi:WXG100 family type VII secretion target
VPIGTEGKLSLGEGHRHAGVTSALAETKVNGVDLHNAAKACDDGATSIVSTVSSMMNQLDQTSAQWKGKAALTFEEVKQTVRTELNNLVDALQDLSGAMKSGHAQMMDADHEASGKLQGAIADALR